MAYLGGAQGDGPPILPEANFWTKNGPYGTINFKKKFAWTEVQWMPKNLECMYYPMVWIGLVVALILEYKQSSFYLNQNSKV